MTRDPRPPSGTDPLDDGAIGQLIRDVAEGWTMPPVRLDAPSWRDRVRTPGARRLAGAGGWLRRLGGAATAAIALTVAAALLAVVITRPPDDAGKSPAPSDGTTPRPSEEAQATLLPKLLVNGDLPNPSEIVVTTEQGDFAMVNLADGSIGEPLTGARFRSKLRVRADGTMVCLCLSESDSVGGSPTHAEVTLDRFDASGTRVSSTPIESFSGEPDPRDEGRVIAADPLHVVTEMAFSSGGRYGFVGWSVRAHPAWHNGILVVDLQSGNIVSRIDLPDGPTGEGSSRRVVGAPRVIGSTAAEGLLLGRDWYAWAPAESQGPFYTFGTDAFRVRFAGGELSEPAAVPAAADCGDRAVHGGALPDGGTWLACTSGGGSQTVVRRIAADGSLLGDIRIDGAEGIDGDSVAVSPDGATVFAWDASTATITRIEVATGEKVSRNGLSARAGDPLKALGEWLAPSANAKSILRGAVVVSPDGSRAYAIGIKAGVDDRDVSGSAGVFAFDAGSLEILGTWQPTADFVSIALSSDGRFLYAAGLPGVDERGARRPGQEASITVFDTRDGIQRLIAGELGANLITFGGSPLD